MPEEEIDEQGNSTEMQIMEDLPLRRPTSFAEAQAVTKMRGIEDISIMEKWFADYQDQLQDAADAAAEQTEDKGFWGNIATIGATLGCIALDLATGGVCTVAGLALGSATRIGVDLADDAEAQVPGEAIGPDVDYYRNKIPGLVDDLNDSKEKLDNFHANEWKRDVLLQLNDTFTAVKLGVGMETLGLFSAGEAAGEESAKLVLDTMVDEESLFSSTLFDEAFPTYGSSSASGWVK